MKVAFAVAGVALAAPMARAHQLSCEKGVKVEPGVVYTPPVGGIGYEQYAVIDTYPSTLLYKLTVNNTHDSLPSEVLGAEDKLLAYYGFKFDPAPPFWLPLHGSETNYFPLTIDSYEKCLYVAGLDGYKDEFIDNTFTVTWDDDNASCSARVKCVKPEEQEEECHQTRTIGFYGTHPDALDACLAKGDIDLGLDEKIGSLPEALGIIWGSPARFDTGEKRLGADKARFLLQRQLLAAICNERLFGATTTPSTLITDAQAAAAGLVCDDMHELQSQLDAFNNSGEQCPASDSDPTFGPATPQAARSTANDPTSFTGDQCVAAD